MKKMGRPKVPIDFKLLENLCGIQCTMEEIAMVMSVTVETIDARCQEEHGITFSEYYQQKKAKGKSSLRHKQWQVAMSGDKTLLVWLGKQHLGQTDKNESTMTVTINSWDALEKEIAGEPNARRG